jgi:hypothetical protein
LQRLIDNDFLTMISRLFIGVVLIYASFYKIIDPGAFARSIWFYHLVPGNLINLMALILPWLELLCGLALIFGIYYRGAVIWVNILTVPCRCSSAGPRDGDCHGDCLTILGVIRIIKSDVFFSTDLLVNNSLPRIGI